MKKAFNNRETISLYDEDIHECGDDIQGIDLVEEPPSEGKTTTTMLMTIKVLISIVLLKMNCTLIESVVLHTPCS